MRSSSRLIFVQFIPARSARCTKHMAEIQGSARSAKSGAFLALPFQTLPIPRIGHMAQAASVYKFWTAESGGCRAAARKLMRCGESSSAAPPGGVTRRRPAAPPPAAACRPAAGRRCAAASRRRPPAPPPAAPAARGTYTSRTCSPLMLPAFQQVADMMLGAPGTGPCRHWSHIDRYSRGRAEVCCDQPNAITTDTCQCASGFRIHSGVHLQRAHVLQAPALRKVPQQEGRHIQPAFAALKLRFSLNTFEVQTSQHNVLGRWQQAGCSSAR